MVITATLRWNRFCSYGSDTVDVNANAMVDSFTAWGSESWVAKQVHS